MDIKNFLEVMEKQAASPKREFEKGKTVEKISLNFEGNHGRYQVIPIKSVANPDSPFVQMKNTREICIPRKFLNKDGQETPYQDWVKILPKNAYTMLDQTGRRVSSLTSEEDRLLTEAYQIFDSLYQEIDAKNNRDIAKELLRKRNYTIFHAYCLNKWGNSPDNNNSSRNPVRQNFSGLFISTAAGFMDAVYSNISETSLIEGNDNWISDVYDNGLTDLKGFMIFTINRNSAGYTVTVNHKANAQSALQGITIPEEDVELMKDPLVTFLGRQAKYEEGEIDPTQRRLFNASLIREAIEYMTSQLAAIRMAAKSGMTVQDAIKTTTETTLNNIVLKAAVTTNDPMLKQEEAPAAQPNVENIVANNNAPFQTPPTAHIDPLTSAPVNSNSNSNPFEQNVNFGQSTDGKLPF
jgi:hypothetical protein